MINTNILVCITTIDIRTNPKNIQTFYPVVSVKHEIDTPDIVVHNFAREKAFDRIKNSINNNKYIAVITGETILKEYIEHIILESFIDLIYAKDVFNNRYKHYAGHSDRFNKLKNRKG